MVQANEIYILIIKVDKFSFFSLRCFLKEIENMFAVFLLSYRNTCESLGELGKAVVILDCGSCSHSISCSPKLPLIILWLDRNTVHVFYFLNVVVFFHSEVHAGIWANIRRNIYWWVVHTLMRLVRLQLTNQGLVVHNWPVALHLSPLWPYVTTGTKWERMMTQNILKHNPY